LKLCIDNKWYDLSKWKHSHPGGAEILEHLNGQDATDAFYSLHSKEAIAKLQKMYATPVQAMEVAKPTAATLSFRKLRSDLEKEGWFKRSLFWELFYHLSVYTLALLGTYMAVYNHPIYAMIFIGLSMQQSGWIGHDYVHGRGVFQYYMGRSQSGLINAFSPTWWSGKHNTHHVYTNYIGLDVDIENDPVFHLFFPDPENDVFFRKLQHLYFIPVASFLFVSWRIQSLLHSLRQGNGYELLIMACNYLWLYSLGWQIALGSLLIGGGLVAIIVTATHQSEEMLQPSSMPYSFVECQFATTRDARCADPVMEWLWGGMQYQLEHHLFPTMPKYRYAALSKRLEQWAAANGLEYRVDTVWQIWLRNYETMKYFAQPANKKLD
jgi:fatty acid desaturase